MRSLLPLSACGSARLAFEGFRGSDPDRAGYEKFLDRLRSGVKVFAMGEEIVQLAADLASFAPSLAPDDKKALTLLAVCSLIAVRQGSTLLPLKGDKANLADVAFALLSTGDADALSEHRGLLKTIGKMLEDGRAATLIGGAGEFKPIIVDGEGVYLQRMLQLELDFCSRLRKLSRRITGVFPQEDIARILNDIDGQPLRLTDEQKNAVTVALARTVTIISGGPGTGKTSIVVSILRVLMRLGMGLQEILLTAPTGKAANRLTESLRAGMLADSSCSASAPAGIAEASTIHRLLRYSAARDLFIQNENNRLPGRVVIVDEASMIDLSLMERLMSALPDDALLILLGDADQLPSVEAGAVLGELMQLEKDSPEGCAIGIVRLTKSFRMRKEDPAGRKIYMLADAIRRGAADELRHPDATLLVNRPSAEDCVFKGAEFLDTSGSENTLNDFCSRWYSSMVLGLHDFRRLISKRYYYGREGFRGQALLDLHCLFDHFEGFRMLCVTNVYSTGTEALNRLFHIKALEREGFDRPAEFAPGEPVLVERNDYAKNLFNGDHGLVLRVSPRKGVLRLMAVFRRGDAYVAYPTEALRGGVSLAYAVSVHRSQGSEYRSIALILPEQDVKILTQEILYTAITRAKTGAVLVGKQGILLKGVQTRVQRACGIGRRLRQDS
ncbi:MAG: exodeoxyribonuclease V subunit alpha [Nitrospirae bacterium]|nr:MAG: exodeoxyribonuclease V subunit alpha [Nitrospirota bacterium]